MLFKDIPGHKKVKEKLIRAVQEQRVSHTQLFLGAEGSHKLALAIAYAQYVNCEHRTADDSCGVCPSCIKYQKLAHPDLHFIYPVAPRKNISKPESTDFIKEWRELLMETNQLITIDDWHHKIELEGKKTIINVKDCGNIIQKLSLKSYESEYRVVVMWMVERLYREAAPKLLKVLEEPPEKTLFLLVAENQDLLLNTIKSRTQLVKILPYSYDEVRSILLEKGIAGDVASDVAIRSQGNLHKALELAGAGSRHAEYFGYLSSWLRGCFRASITEMTDAIAKFSKGNREDTRHFLEYTQELIRDAMLVNRGAAELSYRYGDEKTFVQKLSPFIHPDVLPGFYMELNDAIYQISHYGNVNIILTDLSFKMSNFLHIPQSKA